MHTNSTICNSIDDVIDRIIKITHTESKINPQQFKEDLERIINLDNQHDAPYFIEHPYEVLQIGKCQFGFIPTVINNNLLKKEYEYPVALIKVSDLSFIIFIFVDNNENIQYSISTFKPL